MSIEPGVLYVVATPIGNLGDIGQRALDVLARVDLIAAEDTRHTAGLLNHYAIRTPRVSLHEHNEDREVPRLLGQLREGRSLALVSDAGTPLISDPGYRLVHAARQAGIRVSPVPGPSAAIAALSVSGLASDRFVFEGFLPARSGARRRRLQELAQDPRTLIIYESSHRIVECLEDLRTVLGAQRHAVVARELTKAFEQVVDGNLDSLCAWTRADPNHSRGEFVVLVEGTSEARSEALDAQAERVLGLLLADLPAKQAVKLAAEITGMPRNLLYDRALQIKSGA